jgi:hypothetical protein
VMTGRGGRAFARSTGGVVASVVKLTPRPVRMLHKTYGLDHK